MTGPKNTNEQVIELLREVQSNVIVLTEWRKQKDKRDEKNETQIDNLVATTHQLQIDFVVFKGMGGDVEKVADLLETMRQEVNDSKQKTARNSFNLVAGTRAMYGLLWLVATVLTTWLTAYFGSFFGPTNGGGS